MINLGKCVGLPGIRTRTNYYTLFIAILITLNYNYLEASERYFTAVIYGLHTIANFS